MRGRPAYTLPRVRALLLINPRAGTESPTPEELRDEALARGIDAHVLEEGEDIVELAGRADVEVLGAAGGDGTVAGVAAVAIDRDLPFVVVPYGTRNHFARDLGLNPPGRSLSPRSPASRARRAASTSAGRASGVS